MRARWAPRCPAGAGVSTAHGRPAEAGARRARAAKSPSGVRGRGWTRVGRCAWTGAFEDVLLPRFSRGASGVTDARGSCSRPPSRRPAQTRRAEGKGCESGRALVRGGVAGTAVRGSGPAGGRGGQPSCRPSRVAGRGERTALGNRSPEPRAGTLARKERGRETLAVASRPRAPVRGAESRRRLRDAHRTPEGPPKRSRDFDSGNLRSCDTSPHVGRALASEKLDIDTTRVSFLPASC